MANLPLRAPRLPPPSVHNTHLHTVPSFNDPSFPGSVTSLPLLHAVPVVLQQKVSAAVQVFVSSRVSIKLHRRCEKSSIGDFSASLVYRYIHISYLLD